LISEKPENREKKKFLYGISMGGSVALLLNRKEPAYWDGAVLLAPMCKVLIFPLEPAVLFDFSM
jgi:acylglycerol lipase